jgi:hypothetical protein
MIDKIENNQVPDVLKDTSKQAGASIRKNNSLEDASLQITSESQIIQANQPPTQNSNAVEEARQLLLSGQLDTPENIRAAAEAIAKFGV